MNTLLFSFCCVLALTSFVLADTASFKVNYILTDNNLYPNGQIPGLLYYRFNTAAPQTSKVRFEHTLYVGGRPTTVVELEDFSSGKLFKICGQTCESYSLSRTAQQWWYKAGDAKKDGEAIDGFEHYTRSVTDYGVTDLWLKNTGVPSNTLYIKKLAFNTGRVLSFVDGYATVDFEDKKFDPNDGGVQCSSTKCSTYMDLIFVLDSSASVKQHNWNIMVEFVKNVTKQTDISAQAAAVSVVGFGGTTCNARQSDCQGDWHGGIIDDPSTGTWVKPTNPTTPDGVFDVYRNNVFMVRCAYVSSGLGGWTKTYYPSASETVCKGVNDNKNGYKSSNGYSKIVLTSSSYYVINDQIIEHYNRCGKDFDNCTYSDDPFISKIYFDLTYKQMDDVLKDIQNKVTYDEGDTCQALGLIKAIDTLNKNNRARENDGLVPQRVIIVLTDGDDHCAEMTKHYADVLRNNYNAIVIEVSITLKHLYDKQLLESIASKFGGVPSYFDVEDFSALQQHIDKMVSSVCRTNYSAAAGSCDKKCKGFCGCGGECFCPSCDSSLNNECHNYGCSVVGNVTAGCVDTPTECNDGKYCTDEVCVVGKGCEYTERSCDRELKTCQVSKCSESLEGQCEDVKKFDSLCPAYDFPCYTAICDPENAASDSVSGCRYEYACVGKLPAEYNEDGTYKSGCYEYTCDNSTGQCGSTNVCDRMSQTNLCTDYVCNEDLGKCVESKQKVTCPSTTPCRPQSVCNPVTGQCDIVDVTPADCKSKFKEEASKHKGEDGWFANDDDIETYYSCGTHKCDDSASGASQPPSKNQNGHCIFEPGDDFTCGACSGSLSSEVSFEVCEGRALDKHKAETNKCFTSSCNPTGETSSECLFTEITCESIPCMNVVCNQSTLKCEYTWTDEYLQMKSKENACEKVQCVNNVPKLVDISIQKCVGTDDTNASVPVCKEYDRCDAKAGCIYKEKCVRTNNCTTMTCDMSSNECIEESVVCPESGNICFYYECSKKTDNCEVVLKSVEDACGTTDKCHQLSCSVVMNKCISEQIPFPNETDKCHNYTCHNETGLWSVTEKCDDDNICTVDTCSLYDGSCTNFKRDCHELNMTGYGSCFGRSCSTSRKNGCFRRVYENSYFDECGNCIRGYNAEDSGVTESEVSDCKRALSFQEEAAVISAGILTAIIAACVIGGIAVSTAGTLATKELIKRARAANDSGSHDNPLFEEDGQELENPTFVGNE